MTRDEFAALLNGREYGAEMTNAEGKLAEDSGLLVVFGASDDLTEFRGVIYDEAGAYDGAEHLIKFGSDGWYVSIDDCEGKGNICTFFEPADPRGAAWLIMPTVPFAPFDIMEDGDLYCRGAVIDAADLLPKQRVKNSAKGGADSVIIFLTDDLTDDDLASLRRHLAKWSRQ